MSWLLMGCDMGAAASNINYSKTAASLPGVTEGETSVL